MLKGDFNSGSGSQNNDFISAAAVGVGTGVLSSSLQKNNVPPSLEEINSGKVCFDSNGVRNLEYITANEEQEGTRKRDLLFKFKILKKKYTNGNIPEFSEHTDIKILQKEYDTISKQIEIDVKVAKYKKWMFFAFMGLEFVIKNFLSFQDIIGFANHQSECIHEYESLLVELSEKNYIDNEKHYPVELRLLAAICMNTGIFVFGRMVEKHLGSRILSGFSNVMNNATSQYTNNPQMQNAQNISSQTQQKKKMRGPDLDDLEDISEKKYN